MNVQENKIRIFIQTAAMLRLRDSANQGREISNKRFERENQTGPNRRSDRRAWQLDGRLFAQQLIGCS